MKTFQTTLQEKIYFNRILNFFLKRSSFSCIALGHHKTFILVRHGQTNNNALANWGKKITNQLILNTYQTSLANYVQTINQKTTFLKLV